MSIFARGDSATEDSALYETNAETIYVPVAVFLVVSPIAVGARIWSRVANGGRLGLDDLTIVVSLAFALASGGIMLAACHYGYGRHVKSLSPDDRYQAFKVTYKTCINLTKSSILLLYLRIFGNTKWFRWACRFMLTCIVMYCIASVTATIFQCTPITKAFDKSMHGVCIDNGHFWYANAGFSISTDVIILTLPMPLVYALQIPRFQKAALIMVFAFGVFVVITSCLRVTTLDIQATSPDPLFDIASTMWTVIEMNVAIVCACLPQVRPLIVKWFPRLMPSRYPNSPGSSGKRRTHPSGDRPSRPRPYLSTEDGSYSTSEEGKWMRIKSGGGRSGQEGTNLSDFRKTDSSSEECILKDEGGLQIHKTVKYTVEYTPDGKLNPHNGMMV
ncbi:hypothetical protein M426DRAFT_22327 [Hypoxylon sp. CI-4A]|nr:hypothetical protein M426DRAFT_22327 [Hypoxylon sp. CI-4A]